MGAEEIAEITETVKIIGLMCLVGFIFYIMYKSDKK